MSALPIEVLHEPFLAARGAGAVVVEAPTGSGKSTRVPVWAQAFGPVLVVQPRRVACRALAVRIAEEQGATLGAEVGWIVRDDRRAGPATPLVLVTTGVALRMVRDREIDRYATVVLDEVHERSLELDLLLALLARRAGLVAMSATLDGGRLAAHLGAAHLVAEGRTHPVAVVHPPDAPKVPEPRGLESSASAARWSEPRPMATCSCSSSAGPIRARRRRAAALDVDVLELHGGLSLDDQARVFRPAAQRRSPPTSPVTSTVPGSGYSPQWPRAADATTTAAACSRWGRSRGTPPSSARGRGAHRRGRWWLRQPNVPLSPPRCSALHRESLVPLSSRAAVVRRA
ncbi:MAG: hypothetical protein R3F59_25300 [Myxococcota bacterium]